MVFKFLVGGYHPAPAAKLVCRVGVECRKFPLLIYGDSTTFEAGPQFLTLALSVAPVTFATENSSQKPVPDQRAQAGWIKPAAHAVGKTGKCRDETGTPIQRRD